MKKITLTFVAVISAVLVLAQTPQAFKYQAVVRDNLGEIVANEEVNFRFSIRDEIPVGPILYQETQLEFTDAYGRANLEIGRGDETIGVFEDIDWGDDDKFLEVEFDPAGNTAYVSMGTTQLLAVPYALYSESSGDAGAAEIDDLTDGRTIGLSVFLGSGTGYSDDGSTNRNTAIGYDALHLNTFGFNNTANGYNALYSNTSGRDNVASGHSALYSNTTGGFNVGFGMSANRLNQTGSQNTIIGYEAGRGTSLHNKSGSVFIGYRAGYNETGSNKLYIQNDSSSTPLIGGDFSVDEIYLNGKVGIGTSNPEYNLTVSDDIYSHSSFIGVSKTNYTDTWNNLDGSIAMPLGFIGTQGSWRSSWVWNGYRNSSNTWTSLGLNGYTSAYAIELGYDGIYFRTASEVLTGNSPPIRMFIDDIGNIEMNGLLELQDGVSVNEFSNDTTMAGSSETTVPTEKAVKSYVDHIGTVPIGSIIAWAKNFSGVPALPDNYVECNGQVINDPDSPLNGYSIPMLNDERYLKGSIVSGLSGGSNDHSHYISGITGVGSFPVHVEEKNYTNGEEVNEDYHTHSINLNSDNTPHEPRYNTVVWIMRIK